MYIFYLLALIPVFVGCCFWIYNKEFTFWEWMLCVLLSFSSALGFHLIVKFSSNYDTQFVSGKVIKATFHPEWVEQYLVPIYRTVCRSSGKSTYCTSQFSHYETRYRTHDKFWDATSDIPSTHVISASKFQEIKKVFKNLNTEKPYKSGFFSGDPNVYVSYNKTNVVIPINEETTWTNPIKNKSSLFNFSSVSSGDLKKIYEYPKSTNWFVSPRLLGGAKKRIPTKEWDILNTELDKKKKVNLIMVEFPDTLPSDICLTQEAYWKGGKQKDIVLCYRINADNIVSSAYVFGWTESELLKRNLETLLLTSKIDKSVIPQIKEQVESFYILKDFTKYKYISTKINYLTVFLYCLFLICVSSICIFFCLTNSYSQNQSDMLK